MAFEKIVYEAPWKRFSLFFYVVLFMGMDNELTGFLRSRFVDGFASVVRSVAADSMDFWEKY